jgi:hypothetical protein
MSTHTIVVTLETEGDLTLEEVDTIMGNLKDHIEYERGSRIAGFEKVTAIDVSLTGGEPVSPTEPAPAA